MSSLGAFLNPIKTENKEVIVSNRFVEKGKSVPFVIRAISQEENKQLIKKFTRRDKNDNEIFDRVEYVSELTSRAVVFPDLKNAELQKAYGVLGESALLQKMLYIGEYAKLAQAVQELSGLDEDINDNIEEVKNE
ncbi:phage tail assembly chaperone [Sporanaerobacter sp. PP17-6a]|uniref:phage tail assembly chaperone n=1 Tax=Sporanaerobacter sp. PP17-6a TaxID=1891289 RepID=UPI0008A08430|nr:phage portal protein [Sporanaerobacter sp. PP17-6a]SCL85121.1 Phage XkdN-like protein [Sporanaerobacter sp. PP17-6a]